MATQLRHPKGYVFFDNDGEPLASGTVQYYEAGTTTDEPIYSDAAGATALPNPITLNSAGRAVDGSNNLVAIYLSDAGGVDYKEEVKDSGGVTIWTDDDIPQPVDPADSLSDTAKPRIQWSTDTDSSVSLTAGHLGGGRLADSSSNNITYTPISASTAGNGNGYLIKKTNASNTVTFDPDGSETVDGASTYAWTQDDQAVWIVSDGANWQVALWYAAPGSIGSDVLEAATEAAARTAIGATLSDAVFPGAIVAIIEDQKAQNTAGQSLTTGGDRVRELTTLAYNRNTTASLNSNQFTLPAGTWEISWFAPAAASTAGAVVHQTLLHNATDTADVARGSNASIDSGSGGAETAGAGVSVGSTVTTIASAKAFEIRHRVGTNCSGGYALNQGTEVYTRVVVRAA